MADQKSLSQDSILDEINRCVEESRAIIRETVVLLAKMDECHAKMYRIEQLLGYPKTPRPA